MTSKLEKLKTVVTRFRCHIIVKETGEKEEQSQVKPQKVE